MNWIDIVQLLGGLVLLVLAADWLVDGAVGLARKLGMSMLIIGLTVVAYGTSFPELVVSIIAAFRGSPEIAVGNVLGSNIANICLVLGLTALVCPIPVRQESLLKRELPFLILVTGGAIYFMQSGDVARYEGLILLAAAVFFTVMSVRTQSGAPESEEENEKIIPIWKALILVVLGVAGLVGGAHFMVEGASNLARAFGISERIIGLTIVAVGTSLPELAASISAAIKKQPDLALGNVIGSNFFNLTFVLGGAASIKPFAIDTHSQLVDFGVMSAVTLLLLPFCCSRRAISRIEGGFLACCYVGYIAWLFVA